MKGWVKLHRGITFWEWYDDPNTLRVFLHLLLRAAYEEIEWRGMIIKPGQIITGRKKLANELKLSEQEIRTTLLRLKSTNEITIQTTNKFSVITICKWEIYQGSSSSEQPTNQPAPSPANNQQLTTYKEIKESKKDISTIFNEFRIKYPGTKRGLETELKNFLKKNNPETVHQLLPALNREIAYKERLKSQNNFCPEWKNLSTWINQKCWENEYPNGVNGQRVKMYVEPIMIEI